MNTRFVNIQNFITSDIDYNNYNKLYILQSHNQLNNNELSIMIDNIKNLQNNPSISFITTSTENLEPLLPYLSEIIIIITTNEQFKQFLEFDNHLSLYDTQNKNLTLLVNDTVNIDGIKPQDLPLIWHVKSLNDCNMPEKPTDFFQ